MPDLPDAAASFRLDGKVAIVTGASSGLGARFARVLAGAGASVVLAARRADRLEQLAAELAAELPDALAVAIDLSERDSPSQLIARATERFGRVDVLVNNAGMSVEAAALDIPVDEFRAVVEMNLVVPFALAQAAARVMVDQSTGGSVINIASQYGLVGVNAGLSPYVASKGGLVNLTRQLAVEWARHGIRVNALAPGYFPTEMNAELFADERKERWMRRNTPLGRAGAEHELDGALLLLASDASTFVTGAVLSVDGGWTAS